MVNDEFPGTRRVRVQVQLVNFGHRVSAIDLQVPDDWTHEDIIEHVRYLLQVQVIADEKDEV